MNFLKNRAGGVLLHPTALPSEFGVGDFGSEAYKFIDFLASAGQSFWQVLPLGHTSFGDSPYQCQSAFAGSPILISPEKLAEAGLLSADELKSYVYIEETNSAGDKIDFGKVIPHKLAILRAAYENFKNSSDKSLKRQFQKFQKENKAWLEDYCLFIAYKNYLISQRKYELPNEEFLAYAKNFDKSNNEIEGDGENDNKNMALDCYYGAAWNSWPAGVKNRDKAALKEVAELLEEETAVYAFIQFVFDQQWNALKLYANEKGISVIGDIPIFVALDSADVWANPELFLFDGDFFPTAVAGVPPDYFSETGQLWGNPLYDWEAHRESGYKWWIERVRHAVAQVDYLRIDHFRGFEAYWSIPAGETTAINGKWVKGPGRAVFDAIRQELGKLPIIAEDLGVITPKVERLRDSLGLPGMKILHYGFNEDILNTNKPHNFNSSNVLCYTGTHDNDTSLGWYQSQDEVTQDRFRRYLNVSGDEPSWDLIRLAALSNAVLAMYPVQDILSLDSAARFNEPGTSKGNWAFRMKKEALCENHAQRLRYLMELSDRLPVEC